MRGDSVKVINSAFLPMEAMAVLGILRPIMRHLASAPRQVVVNEAGEQIPEDQLSLSQEGGGRLPKPSTYEDNLNMAKSLAGQEPKRVAQVVKGWLED